MEIQKSTIKNIGIALISLIVIVFLIIAFSNKPVTSSANSGAPIISGDEQIIDLTAKVGYTPQNITAKGNSNTILRVATKNTFDCSSSLRIPSLNITKLLPATGSTDISLGTPIPGTEINGTCSMGMYSFKIKFT
ncbi:MAG: hypothetical protein ABIM99_01475 [Candidatus Dojkabacteria bacterium]